MDPIIRAAAVSPTAWQLRSPQRVAAVVPPPAAPAPAPAASPSSTAPLPANAITPVPAATLPETAPSVAPAALMHQAALRERDAEIDKLREQARKAQLDLSTAFAEAERRGYAAGEEKGERAGMELLQVQADRLKTLALKIGQSRQQVLAEAEDSLLEIAFAAICRILGEQGASRDALQRIVQDAVASARDRRQLTVRLHPDDVALLRLDADAADTVVQLSPDAGVMLGGCIVDSGTGSLDARFETQLTLLGAALSAVRAGRHTGEETL